MHDFYAVLEKAIAETKNNPAQMRQVIYECARLAAKRQALLQSPVLSFPQVQERMIALEQAIARVETRASQEDEGRLLSDGSSQRPETMPLVEGPVSLTQSAYGHDTARDFFAEEEIINIGLPKKPAATAGACCDRFEAAADFPPLWIGQPRHGPPSINSHSKPNPKFNAMVEASVANIAHLAATAAGYASRTAGSPGALIRAALGSVSRLLQFTLAGLLAVAIYAALSMPSADPPPPPPPRASEQTAAVAGGIGPLGANRLAETSAFPLPRVYGVYAVSNARLVELEQIPTAPVDPRTRAVLQITSPSRALLARAAPTFLVYRRDLLTSAPEKVAVRIVARIARAMTFDSAGKAVTAPPPNDVWLVRDAGYDLRVRPAPENHEMILVHSDDPALVLPAGRYVLMFGGNPYDFTIEGAVTDPAHCVESVATTRGPSFFECRAP